MKTTAVLFLVILPFQVFSQLVVVTSHMNRDLVDSVRVVAHVSVHMKMTQVRPPVVYRPQKKTKTIIAHEKPEMVRYLPVGEMGLIVNLREKRSHLIEPHAIFEIAGLATHLSTKLGGGLASRRDGFAFGFFVGQYMRRVDAYADVVTRAKQFESGWHYGYYGLFDRPNFRLGLSYAFEKKLDFVEAEVSWKLGRSISSSLIPPGLEVKLESMSYLGTGGGFSYLFPSGKARIGFSYLIISSEEENREIGVNLVVASGLVARVDFLWF